MHPLLTELKLCKEKEINESAKRGCETEKQTFRNRALCQKTTPCLGGKESTALLIQRGFSRMFHHKQKNV